MPSRHRNLDGREAQPEYCQPAKERRSSSSLEEVADQASQEHQQGNTGEDSERTSGDHPEDHSSDEEADRYQGTAELPEKLCVLHGCSQLRIRCTDPVWKRGAW